MMNRKDGWAVLKSRETGSAESYMMAHQWLGRCNSANIHTGLRSLFVKHFLSIRIKIM